jgi:hypothetical protein
MACHTPRGGALLPTKLHLSSPSAASPRRPATVSAAGQPPSTTLGVSRARPAAFFYFLEPRVGADLPPARPIPDATPLEGPLHNLWLHGGQPSRIGITAYERPAPPVALLTAKPLLALTGFALLPHRITLTGRTPHDCFCPPPFSSLALSERRCTFQQIGDTTELRGITYAD